MKVKIGDRVVTSPHSGPKGPGVVTRLEFPTNAVTGEPMPPYVWVRLDRGGMQIFRMQDMEKEGPR